MGDRTTVTLTVLKSQEADAQNIFDSDSEYRSENGVLVECTFHEVNYGNLDFLDQLQEAGIAYDSRWEAGSNYGAGCDYCRFTPDGDVVLKGISDDYRNPSIDLLMKKLDDYAALKAFIIEHHIEVTVPGWENQEEYAKIYKVKKLIST
jgi:hypothetical protein